MNNQQNECYNDKWRCNRPSSCSWAEEVLNDIDGNGGLYLSKINNWFQNYPGADKSKDQLKISLESYENGSHLGAVNELFWYNLALNLGWKLIPVPVIDKKGQNRPDFECTSPTSFYCEITTLNWPNNNCNKKFPIDNELNRLYGKPTEKNKQAQTEWCQEQKKPQVLIVFDYSNFSGLGTQHQKSLSDFFQNPPEGFPPISEGLSAFLYLERYIEEGKFMLRMSKSELICNRNARFPIEKNIFDWLDQNENLEIT